jgi:putative MATE family efflux protein
MFKKAHFLSSHHRSISMTSGSLWKNILYFSIPLMLSQLLQVLFNMADVAVVGKYASPAALGSVGSTTILVTLFTGFLIGIGCGVNVKVAQYLGAKQHRDLTETIHTSLILCTVAGIIICLLCFLFAEPMLAILQTKPDLIDGAVLYFRIYALGMPALGIFNFGNAVMSANGDTKRPLFYLTIAGILNVLLNLFFVIVCKMAADGVALASIISQYLSAVLILIHLFRQQDACKLQRSFIRCYRGRLRALLALGLPAGIQNSIFAIANLFVQVGVNSFDSTMVSGNAAAANADALIFNIMSAFYTACTSFMGQNRGAGLRRRMLNSYFVSLIYSFAAGALLGILLILFDEPFLFLFTNDEAVVHAGMEKLSIMWFSYAISAVMDCTIAASRGIGKSFVPTVLVILGSCVFRVVWVYTVFAYFHTIPSLYLLYFFSWTITSVAEVIYFASSYRMVSRQMQAEFENTPDLRGENR